ncbi:MAG: hypothetical protein ABR879_01915 [Methanomassiliicoccales archaeon]|jgi:hypothetical protein
METEEDPHSLQAQVSIGNELISTKIPDRASFKEAAPPPVVKATLLTVLGLPGSMG